MQSRALLLVSCFVASRKIIGGGGMAKGHLTPQHQLYKGVLPHLKASGMECGLLLVTCIICCFLFCIQNNYDLVANLDARQLMTILPAKST